MSETGSVGQSRTSDSAVPCLPSSTVHVLMQASLASSTKAQYERACSKLVGFFQSLGTVPVLPVSVAMMGFIAYLHKGYASSSMISTVSAIPYFHKLLILAQLIRALPHVLLYIINALCYGL